MQRNARLGSVIKNIRRLVTKPDRVHVIYDKERTAINPRPSSYLYASLEGILLENSETFAATLEELRPYLACPEIEAVPRSSDDPRTPYWDNGYFSFVDARVAYALTAARRPSRIIEIGSGNSTKFFRKALDDFGIACEITSIDPSPRADIDGISDRVIRDNLLDVDLDLFLALKRNDVLFLDGSHYAFNGTDTTRFFLEILPLTPPGVLVHVHDICLPYEYSELFTERMYNEQYLLACVLLNSREWRPLLPVHYLDTKGYFEALPASDVANTSFWMTRA
jgi:hypothetical protein